MLDSQTKGQIEAIVFYVWKCEEAHTLLLKHITAAAKVSRAPAIKSSAGLSKPLLYDRHADTIIDFVREFEPGFDPLKDLPYCKMRPGKIIAEFRGKIVPSESPKTSLEGAPAFKAVLSGFLCWLIVDQKRIEAAAESYERPSPPYFAKDLFNTLVVEAEKARVAAVSQFGSSALDGWPKLPKKLPDIVVRPTEIAVAVDAAAEDTNSEPTEASKNTSETENNDEAELHWGRIERLLKDTVAHPSVKSFEKFVGEKNGRTSGTWLLKAGPGVGKSVVMAQIADAWRERAFVIPYIFKYNDNSVFGQNDGTQRSSREKLLSYACTQVASKTGLADEKHPNEYSEASMGAELSGLFKRASGKGAVKPEKPLILIIDALDETSAAFRHDNPNPLELNEAFEELPENVFVALSIRAKPDEELALESELRPYPEALTYHNDAHKVAVNNYIVQTLGANRYCEALNRANYEAERSALVESIAKKAGYNFMILKIALRDRQLWQGDFSEAVEQLTHNHNDFYQQHLRRLSNQGKNLKANYNALYLFSYRNRILPELLETFATLKNSHESAAAAEDLVEQWFLQGIIERGTVSEFQDVLPGGRIKDENQQKSSIVWSFPYHKTFRDFIDKQKDQFESVSNWKKLARSLFVDEQSLVNIFQDGSYLEDREACSCIIQLMLRVCKESRSLDYCQKLLLNPFFWQVALYTDDNCADLFAITNNITVSENTRSSWEEALTKVARLLLHLTSPEAGDLRLRNSEGDFFDHANFFKWANSGMAADGENPNTVSLRYFIVFIED